MSRIGKKAVPVPAGVTVTLDGQTVTVKGPKGQLSWTVAEEIEVRQEGAEILLSKREDTTRAQAMWGLSRTLVSNMVVGVTQGYEQTLELVGVGYRAAMKGQALSMQLGFSHDYHEGVNAFQQKRAPQFRDK
jgi:large subunit ribosomal protein L6